MNQIKDNFYWGQSLLWPQSLFCLIFFYYFIFSSASQADRSCQPESQEDTRDCKLVYEEKCSQITPKARNQENQKIFEIKKKTEDLLVRSLRKLLDSEKGLFLFKATLGQIEPKSIEVCTDSSKNTHCLDKVTGFLAKIAMDKVFFSRAPIDMTDYQKFGVAVDDPLYFILKNEQFRNVISNVYGEVLKKYTQSKNKYVLEKRLNRIKDQLVKSLTKRYENHVDFPLVKNKINSVSLASRECKLHWEKNNEYSLNHLISHRIVYLPIENSISLCSGFVSRDIDLFTDFSLAHELAHSIDPCNFGVGIDGARCNYSDPLSESSCVQQNLFGQSLQCMLDELAEANKKSNPAYHYKDKKLYSILCDFHPINETFSDTLAARVLAADRAFFTNNEINELISGFCGLSGSSTHEEPYKRFEKVLRSHLKIVKSLGCKLSKDRPPCF